MLKKRNRSMPEISTASLPDIIFMLLFFFMTVTVLRSTAPKVPVELPDTVSADKITSEADEFNIYIGKDKGGKDRIQINNYIVNIVQLDKLFSSIASGKMDFEKMEVPIYLRVDKNTKMDIVFDVKLSLRKHGLRKINYIVDKAK